MNKLFGISLILLFAFACKEKAVEKQTPVKEAVFNQQLAEELERMEKVDQVAEYIPQ